MDNNISLKISYLRYIKRKHLCNPKTLLILICFHSHDWFQLTVHFLCDVIEVMLIVSPRIDSNVQSASTKIKYKRSVGLVIPYVQLWWKVNVKWRLFLEIRLFKKSRSKLPTKLCRWLSIKLWLTVKFNGSWHIVPWRFITYFQQTFFTLSNFRDFLREHISLME